MADSTPTAPTAPTSAGFDAFFAGSKAVDSYGKPLRLYHGTVNDFTVFDSSRSNVDGYFGAGFYFSNNTNDIAESYATRNGRDFKARVAIEIEARCDDSETHPDLSDTDIESEVLARMAQNDGTTMPVYLAIKNPFLIGGAHETYLDFDDGFSGNGEFGVKTGVLQTFIESLKFVMGGYEAMREFDDLLAALQEDELIEAPGITSSVLIDAVNKLIEPAITNDDGDIVNSEIIRETVERCGFDGIIDRDVFRHFGAQRDSYGRSTPGMPGMTPGTVHYIVFKPEQIKSAIGNNGDFDVANPDIRFSMADLDEDAAEHNTEAPCP